MALNGSPRISAAMRERVLNLAESLGYRPDPALRSLANYRRGQQPQPFRSTLAWVHSMPSAEAWKGSAVYAEFFEAACRRAEKLGYKLENFWIESGRLSERRASQILISRGIRGLILMPHTSSRHHYDLDWHEFNAVRVLDDTQELPRLNTIITDHYGNLRLALAEILARGYRRPCLVTTHELEGRLLNHLSAAYLGAMAASGEKWPGIYWNEEPSEAKFSAWLDKTRADAVLVAYENRTYAGIIRSLLNRGATGHRPVGICMPCLPDPRWRPKWLPDVTGIDECWNVLAEHAVNILVQTLEHFESGIPRLAMRHQLIGAWHHGTTLPPVNE